jgi:hypothetical protein
MLHLGAPPLGFVLLERNCGQLWRVWGRQQLQVSGVLEGSTARVSRGV